MAEPLRVGTNECQPIELEQRNQTVLGFAIPEYVNAFLEQVSIGNKDIINLDAANYSLVDLNADVAFGVFLPVPSCLSPHRRILSN